MSRLGKVGGWSTSGRALLAVAGAALLGTSAQAADLGGNCCADLEERVAELEATTARKGNRKVSLQIYGQVSEAIIFWNDGADKNVLVVENNAIQNRLGFQGSAKINSDWSAGFKFEFQVRAYRSGFANQLSLGASNNTTITAYNTQSVALREAHWFLRSNTYGTITVGRFNDAATGTSTINLVNPDGFAGPTGPGQSSAGHFLRRKGAAAGNAGLSAFTWTTFSWIRNGDGPVPMDYATGVSGIKYTSPFFLGQSKSSGFQLQANWGMDDMAAVALRYAESFGALRVAAAGSYSNWTSADRGLCSTGASGNLPAGNPVLGGTPATDLGSSVSCSSVQASGSLLHVPTGLYVSGGGGQITDKNANAAALARTTNRQTGDGKHHFWWAQAGLQTRLNTLGNTIFWGQYAEYKVGLASQNSIVQTMAAGDVLNSLNTAAIIRSSNTTAVSLGVSQQIDAAAMVLYAGFHNISTEGVLGAIATTARAKANSIEDMQVFYTGATIRF